MAISEKDIMNQSKDQKKANKETLVSRRQFFKKTVYAAPTLVVLGQLIRPGSAVAGSDTRGGPGGGFGGGGFGGG